MKYGHNSVIHVPIFSLGKPGVVVQPRIQKKWENATGHRSSVTGTFTTKYQGTLTSKHQRNVSVGRLEIRSLIWSEADDHNSQRLAPTLWISTLFTVSHSDISGAIHRCFVCEIQVRWITRYSRCSSTSNTPASAMIPHPWGIWAPCSETSRGELSHSKSIQSEDYTMQHRANVFATIYTTHIIYTIHMPALQVRQTKEKRGTKKEWRRKTNKTNKYIKQTSKTNDQSIKQPNNQTTIAPPTPPSPVHTLVFHRAGGFSIPAARPYPSNLTNSRCRTSGDGRMIKKDSARKLKYTRWDSTAPVQSAATNDRSLAMTHRQTCCCMSQYCYHIYIRWCTGAYYTALPLYIHNSTWAWERCWLLSIVRRQVVAYS